MILRVVRPHALPERSWTTLGHVAGGRVEFDVDDERDELLVRVDDFVSTELAAELLETLRELVERATGIEVSEFGPPVL